MIRIFDEKPSQLTPKGAPDPAIQEEAESDITALELRRDQLHADRTILQKEWDDATLEVQGLQAQVAASEGKTYPSSPLGISLSQARHSATQLRRTLDENNADIEKLSKQIDTIKREEPGRLRREALEAALPSLFDFIDKACVAARHEAQYREYGGHVEQPIPWELMLSGGEGILIETLVSKWLEALKHEGVMIPAEISDNARHLPPPASHYARIQTDGNHAAYAASCGARNTAVAVQSARAAGIAQGFRSGRRGF